MRRMTLSLAMCGALLVGCGGSGSSDPKEEIRDVNVEFLQHVQSASIGDACDLTDNPQTCREQFAMLANPGALVNDKLIKETEDAPVTVRGTDATITVDGEETRMTRKGDSWLIVVES